MTMFATVEALENRALAKPHMIAMLSALAHKHDYGLQRSVPAATVWRAVMGNVEAHGQDGHVDAAHNAGFINADLDGKSERKNLVLTDKGRAIIGADKPLWMVA